MTDSHSSVRQPLPDRHAMQHAIEAARERICAGGSSSAVLLTFRIGTRYSSEAYRIPSSAVPGPVLKAEESGQVVESAGAHAPHQAPRQPHGAEPGATQRQIAAAPLVRCDQVQWSFLGFSMAGWNAILSLGGAAVIAFLALKGSRQ